MMNRNPDELSLFADLEYNPSMEDQMVQNQTGAVAAAVAPPVPSADQKPPASTALFTELPPEFLPTNYSVILGRGKGNYQKIGNKRCRIIVKTFLKEFNRFDTRRERVHVVQKVLNAIKEACPVGGFIKREGGKWYEVDEKTAREKIFIMFRDVQNSETRRMSDSSSRSSIRAYSSSPHKLVCTEMDTHDRLHQQMIMNTTSQRRQSFTSHAAKAPSPAASPDDKQIPMEKLASSLPEPEALHNFTLDDFSPIKTNATKNDEDSLGSSCGSFYDIEDGRPHTI